MHCGIVLRDMAVLPVALARDTIVECVFELRFVGAHPSVAEILPGIIFGRYPDRFTNVTTLPLAQMPRSVREQNPQLKHFPLTSLDGPHARMMFGESSVAVSFLKPYWGWAKAKPMILECINAAVETRLTGRPERYGLKYVNVLKEGSDEFDLSQTRVCVELGGFQLKSAGNMAVHGEIELHGCTNIVDIATGGRVVIPGQQEAEIGVIISVDTVRNSTGDDVISSLPHQVLETLHETEKEIFFGLLTDPTIERLGPRYPAAH
jgi:uncharacterized protein (TIGR04255 family)